MIALAPALVALALWAFAWPATRTAPRDLRSVWRAPRPSPQKQLSRHQGAFEIHHYADEAAARDAIEDRTVYGAVVATAQGPKLLTASAASPLVAQLLQQAVTRHAPKGTKVTTTDVVPASAKGPRGAALGASVLPPTLVGIAAGAVVTLLGLRGTRTVAALEGTAALVGVVAAVLAHSRPGVFTGNWWGEAAAAVDPGRGRGGAGLAALIGPSGNGLGAFVVMLLGNPASGASSAPRMLPEPVGTIGHWLPPGAGASLLRSVSFFDGAAATGPALTWTSWAVLGLGAVLLGNALKRGRRTTKAVARLEPALAS